MATRMQQRRGTAAQWISTNQGNGPILAPGEIGFESDNNRFKMGDGINHWVDLPYFSDNEALTDLIGTAPALLNTLGELADALGDDPAFFTTVATNLSNHQSDTTNIHGISDTANLVYQDDLSAKQDVVQDVTSQEIGYLANVTSDIQDQIDSKADDGHTHDLSDVVDVTASVAEVNYLVGVTSLIQDQIDSKADDNHVPTLSDITDVTVSATEINYLEGVTSSVQDQIDGKAVSNHTHTLVDITDITASAVELNVLDGMTALTSELNVLDGIEVSTSELNHLSGITSSVQDQIDGKANSTHTHNLGDIVDVSATVTEINYVSGVTSSIQDQIDSKAPTTHGHSISEVTGLQTELDAKADETHTHAISDVTDLQTSLDAKANLAGATFTGFVSLHSDPTQALHAATKEYVDNIASGIISKPATYAATTANLDAIYDNGTDGVGATLTASSNGAFPVVDGVQLSTSNGYRGILVKNQTNPAHNGRYNLTTLGDANTPWVLTKCSLCDTANEIPGSYIFVTDGTVNGGTGWVLYVNDPATFVVGTDAVSAFQFSGSGTYSAGPGLELSGTQFSVDFDTVAPLASPAFTGTVDMSAATVTGMYLTSDAFENLNLTSLATNEILVYDGTNWVNKHVNSIPAKSASPSLTSNNYNLAATDAGMIIEISNSVAATVTIPSDESFSVGTQIVILQTGAGEVSVNVQSPAVQNLNYSPGNKLRGQWSAATLLKRASSTWVLYGDLAE